MENNILIIIVILFFLIIIALNYKSETSSNCIVGEWGPCYNGYATSNIKLDISL